MKMSVILKQNFTFLWYEKRIENIICQANTNSIIYEFYFVYIFSLMLLILEERRIELLT